MPLPEGFHLCPMKPEATKMVLDNWIRCYRESPWAGIMPNHKAFAWMHDAILGLLKRGARITLVAANHDPAAFIGWVCHEPVKNGVAVHFLYVKDAFRRTGVGSHLLETVHGQTPGDRFYTCRTRDSAYFPDWRYAPEIARRKG